MSKILSIITVNKDACEDLALTINSLLSIFIWDRVEYIVIDGGSSDASHSVISKYKNYIDKYISEPDAGIYDAMNKGVSISSGEWLWFLNSGDQSRINLIELQNIFFNINPHVNFLYSDFFIGNKKIVYQELNSISLLRGMINHQSIFYKRNLFGRFDLNFKSAADFAHLLNIFEIIDGEKIPYPVVEYNLCGVSSSFTKKMRVEVWYYRMLAFSRANLNIFYKIIGMIFCLTICLVKVINPNLGSNILKLRKDLEIP